MKMEISKLLAGLLICAGLMACSPEKPASEKTVDGKTGNTNELVIANTDANALPSQEEDFSEETKAKLKKLREEAAILKAQAELDQAKIVANQKAAINSPTIVYNTQDTAEKVTAFSLTKQDMVNRIESLYSPEDQNIIDGLKGAFNTTNGGDGKLDIEDVTNFRDAATSILKQAKPNMKDADINKRIQVLTMGFDM